MSSPAETCLQRATAYLDEGRDSNQDSAARFEALDASRAALLDARRARAPPQLILPIFEALLAMAAIDSSHNIRMVVPQVVEELCFRDVASYVPSGTSFLLRALHDDNNLVVNRAVRALTTLFRRLVGFVVKHGVGENAFPEGRLSAWLQMEAKALSLMASHDEGLRKAATKFAETVVLAFSYSGGSASSEHFTLEYIVRRGSDSPLLNCEKLEQEGVQCVKAVAQLVYQSLDGQLVTEKPDHSRSLQSLPAASFMTAITILTNLVRRRPKIIDFTLPPLLSIVATITAARRPPSRAFLSLPIGQQLSITTVLKLSLQSLRGFAHTRDDRWNNDIGLALNDLTEYERRQEAMRKERAATVSAASPTTYRSQKVEGVLPSGVPPRKMEPSLNTPEKVESPHHQSHPGAPNMHKRPRVAANVPGMHGQKFSASEALALTQQLVRSMRPQEVVNFITTRLLLNIPPADTIPGAAEAARRANKRAAAALNSDEHGQKKQKRSRFSAKEAADPHRGSSTSATVSVKKVAVRKVAPPVVAIKLSNIASDRLVALCCRRILKRETEARISGALPLRLQLLSRILTSFARKESAVLSEFCDEVCTYIIDNIDNTMTLAQAWLHSLAVADGVSHLKSVNLATIEKSGNAADNDQNGKGSRKMEDTAKTLEMKTLKTNKSTATPREEIEMDVDSEKERTLVTQPSDNSSATDSMKTQNSKKTVSSENENRNGSAIAQGGGETASKAPILENGSGGGIADASINGKNAVVAVEGRDSREVILEDDNWKGEVVGKGYVQIFVKLLDLMKKKEGFPVELYGKVIADAPVVPEAVIKIVLDLCKDPLTNKTGLQTMCTIAMERFGPDRLKCLSLLLDLTRDENDAVRGPAIRLMASQMFNGAEGEVTRLIEERTVENLRTCVDAVCKEVLPGNLAKLERVSLLMTALCGKKHVLLRHLAEAFVKLPLEGKNVIMVRAKDLATHVGTDSGPLLQLIAGSLLSITEVEGSNVEDKKKTDGAEDLALHALRAVVVKLGQTSDAVVEAGMERYQLCGNVAFVLTVLGGLSREDVVKHLGAIVEHTGCSQEDGEEDGKGEEGKDDKTSTKGSFKEVINKVTSGKSAALNAADLLMELHKLKASPAVKGAIQECFEHKGVFKQEAIAQAVQQLIERTVIADLCMRTVILARLFHPELEGYLTDTVMPRLIRKKIWTNEVLWDEFLRYCCDIKEIPAVELLLSLPIRHFEDALNRKQEFVTMFRELANSKSARRISPKYRKVVGAALKKSTPS